jgi:hypothetical protein
MTPSGIEEATFRFVALYLNHCATISGPQQIKENDKSTATLVSAKLAALFNVCNFEMTIT